MWLDREIEATTLSLQVTGVTATVRKIDGDSDPSLPSLTIAVLSFYFLQEHTFHWASAVCVEIGLTRTSRNVRAEETGYFQFFTRAQHFIVTFVHMVKTRSGKSSTD